MASLAADQISSPAASILVVDDMPANLKLLNTALRARGYEVRPVISGKMALEAARLKTPDLILLDINMPKMDGYQVCERLKEDPALAAVPVIFLSALDETIDKVKGFGVGAVDYITKPFQLQEVEARIGLHLELARLRRRLEQHNLLLEEAVAARTRELTESHARLEEAHARLAVLDQAKSEFLEIIAHELRTPLTGIFSIAELLLGSCPPETGARFSPLFERGRLRLVTLIEDALLLSRIGMSPSTGDETVCRLESLLQDACSHARPFAECRTVELGAIPEEIGPVFGEPEYLTRALQSLLETAIKFADADTAVRIAKIPDAKEIGISFEADGTDIPPDLLPRFFHLLGISETLTSGGDLGLAPYMAERIVSLYGGKVSVENLDPPGIRLTITLKAATAVA